MQLPYIFFAIDLLSLVSVSPSVSFRSKRVSSSLNGSRVEKPLVCNLSKIIYAVFRIIVFFLMLSREANIAFA